MVKQIIYGAKDVEYLIDIKDKQMESINRLDLKNVLDLEHGAFKKHLGGGCPMSHEEDEMPHHEEPHGGG